MLIILYFMLIIVASLAIILMIIAKICGNISAKYNRTMYEVNQGDTWDIPIQETSGKKYSEEEKKEILKNHLLRDDEKII